MLRRAFVLSVNPGCEAEYERRHTPIWTELEATLRRHGVHAYSIFLEPESRQLFGYVEFSSQEQWDAIAGTDACRRWWRHMRDLMPTHADDRPVSRELREVFRLGPESDCGRNDSVGLGAHAPSRATDGRLELEVNRAASRPALNVRVGPVKSPPVSEQ